MIQRPQTLFFLTVLVISLMLLFSHTVFFTSVKGDESVKVSFDQTEIHAVDGDDILANVPLVSVLAGIALLALASILLYKNRRLQASLTAFNFVAMITLVIFMYLASLHRRYFDQAGELNFYALLPFTLIFFNYLGLRGIRKDERLIRSMDRFR